MITPEKPKLNEALNWQACLVVMNSVAIFPQSDKSQFIVADMIMRSYDSNYSGKVATPTQIGQVLPEGQRCADQINLIHSYFPFKRRTGPVKDSEAVAAICYFGIRGLEVIRNTVVEIAAEGGYSMRDLPLSFVINPTETVLNPKKVTSDNINWRAASILDQFLQEQIDIQKAAAERIKVQADDLRSISKSHRSMAVFFSHFQAVNHSSSSEL